MLKIVKNGCLVRSRLMSRIQSPYWAAVVESSPLGLPGRYLDPSEAHVPIPDSPYVV